MKKLIFLFLVFFLQPFNFVLGASLGLKQELDNVVSNGHTPVSLLLESNKNELKRKIINLVHEKCPEDVSKEDVEIVIGHLCGKKYSDIEKLAQWIPVKEAILGSMSGLLVCAITSFFHVFASLIVSPEYYTSGGHAYHYAPWGGRLFMSDQEKDQKLLVAASKSILKKIPMGMGAGLAVGLSARMGSNKLKLKEMVLPIMAYMSFVGLAAIVGGVLGQKSYYIETSSYTAYTAKARRPYIDIKTEIKSSSPVSYLTGDSIRLPRDFNDRVSRANRSRYLSNWLSEGYAFYAAIIGLIPLCGYFVLKRIFNTFKFEKKKRIALKKIVDKLRELENRIDVSV